MEGDGEVEMFVDKREEAVVAAVAVVVGIDLAFGQGSEGFTSHGWA